MTSIGLMAASPLRMLRSKKSGIASQLERRLRFVISREENQAQSSITCEDFAKASGSRTGDS